MDWPESRYVDFPTRRLVPKASATHYRELIARARTAALGRETVAAEAQRP